MMLEAKLPFTELGHDVGGREERFASNYAETLTGGKYGPVRASGRAYTGFLDKTRADVFDHLIQRAQSQGVNVQDTHFLESLGRYIGSATGRDSITSRSRQGTERGPFPGPLASRPNLLNPLLRRPHPFARKRLSARDPTAGMGTLLTLLPSSWREVIRIREPDWAKIRSATRASTSRRFQQELRVLAQFASGVAISRRPQEPDHIRGSGSRRRPTSRSASSWERSRRSRFWSPTGCEGRWVTGRSLMDSP
jgi:hypothetical protein